MTLKLPSIKQEITLLIIIPWTIMTELSITGNISKKIIR